MQTIIVTGANGHLGLEVVNNFLEKGYRVLATVRSEKALKALPTHENLEVHIVDLNNEASTTKFVQDAIAAHQGIDAACMLAGGFAMGDLSATAIEQVNAQIRLNFETAYIFTHALFPSMMEKGNGRLIYIGARPAIVASYGKNMVAYALAKSMLFKLAEFVNAAAKGTNVTATVIAPATIDTPPNREAMPDAETAEWVTPKALADLMEMVVSEKGTALRELVLKAYNKG